MSQHKIGHRWFFNGIDGSTGLYLTPPLTARQVTKLAVGSSIDEEVLQELRNRYRFASEPHLAPRAGVDAQDLGESGWGVVFGSDVDESSRQALGPLLALRREQAGDLYNDFPGERAFRPGDTKGSFLRRSGVGFGPVNPRRVPYYLLLVGSPESIPYSFQYQMDVQYAVGRLHFTAPEQYADYAESVVGADRRVSARPPKLTLFGVRNPDDPATQVTADHLIAPLARLARHKPAWKFDLRLGQDATRAAFVDLLQKDDAPALLVSASHGLWFPRGHSLQRSRQGAILCQDWPGPVRHVGPIPEAYYVSGDQIASSARFGGMVAFLFGCYTGGTPRKDGFAHLSGTEREEIAPHSFLASLPEHLLGRPGGALAVIGHVERAWLCSFYSEQVGRQAEAFDSTIRSLLDGWRVGAAMEWLNSLHAELASDLVIALEERKYRRPRCEEETTSDDEALASAWTANNDVRGHIVIGDPAVRLAVQ